MTGRPRNADDLRAEIDELFDDLWRVPRFSGMRHTFRPPCDCLRTDDPPCVHVVLELPGAQPETTRVVASGRTLVVAGVRERPGAAAGRYRLMEIEYGAFQRRVDLGEDVDHERMETRYEHGMLHVVIPLAGDGRP